MRTNIDSIVIYASENFELNNTQWDYLKHYAVKPFYFNSDREQNMIVSRVSHIQYKKKRIEEKKNHKEKHFDSKVVGGIENEARR